MCILDSCFKICSDYCLSLKKSGSLGESSTRYGSSFLSITSKSDAGSGGQYQYHDDPYKKMTNERNIAEGGFHSNSASGSRFSTKDSVRDNTNNVSNRHLINMAAPETMPLIQCNNLCPERSIDAHEIKRIVGDVRPPAGFDPESSLVAMNFPRGTTEIEAASFFTWFVPVVRVEKIGASTAAGEQNFSMVRFHLN